MRSADPRSFERQKVEGLYMQAGGRPVEPPAATGQTLHFVEKLKTWAPLNGRTFGSARRLLKGAP
jgi:hypothetical protein